ncbi:MAG: hypothetical protein MUO82_02245 [Candidatus Thermoplasmatota archaeon]|nr:hypothetical protein [Candidatus Thermoplasmatota archaeon]
MRKNHYKTLTLIFIIFIINSSLIFTIKADNQSNFKNDDEIDEIQTQSDIYEEIYGDIIIGQSFRPDLGNLTRIELLLSKKGNVKFNITVGIREQIAGQDFINISIPPTKITTNQQWIQINFTNIVLNTEGKAYYIVCKTSKGDQNNSYRWYASATDTYPKGIQYYTDNSGETWSQNTSRDLCFITHGKEIIKDTRLEITYVTGKSGKTINVGIENTGEADIKNIEVYLGIEIGLLLKLNTHYNDTIELLKAGKLGGLIFPNIFVLRPIAFGNIKVTVLADGIDAINKTYSAFFLPFYIYISK